ncbi:MAG: helicase-related protein [Planctomycetota bacterium]
MHPQPVEAAATLEVRNGELRVGHWPPGLRPPHGLTASGTTMVGLPRHRRAVLDILAGHQVACTDVTAPAPIPATDLPAPPDPAPPFVGTWLAHDGRGIVAGCRDAERIDAVVAAIWHTRARALVVVRDSGAAFAWQRTLVGHCRSDVVAVATAAEAARTMHWRSTQHDLLAIDRPEQMPATTRSEVLDHSAARQRLAFVDDAHARGLLEWTPTLGPLLAVADPAAAPQRVGLRLPLSPAERAEHDDAWHHFLCAYDTFLSLRPQAGFATFVQQARNDPQQRPALSAWHRVVRVAAWNAAKERTTGELLARHRGQRVLVFTPDRASAYQLARTHLIAPVTAELPRREREQLLAAFACGDLRALVGPRLLDLGVPAGSADVGILVGTGFGQGQRSARLARIAPTGVVYELLALDTLEVGRAQRLAAPAAGAAAGRHGDGR